MDKGSWCRGARTMKFKIPEFPLPIGLVVTIIVIMALINGAAMLLDMVFRG